jgi:hypothetical protein
MPFEYTILDAQYILQAAGNEELVEVTVDQINALATSGWRLIAAVSSPYRMGTGGCAARYILERATP